MDKIYTIGSKLDLGDDYGSYSVIGIVPIGDDGILPPVFLKRESCEAFRQTFTYPDSYTVVKLTSKN